MLVLRLELGLVLGLGLGLGPGPWPGLEERAEPGAHEENSEADELAGGTFGRHADVEDVGLL